MNRLNIEDYDLSYDFQFIRFMIDLLEPVIVFENKGMIIKQRINKKGKNQEVEISRNEYIKFIQYIFPMEIKDEIDRAEDEKAYEEYKKEILSNKRKSKPRFRMPLFIEEDDVDKYNEILKELNKLNDEDIQVVIDQNKERLEDINDRLRYYKEIKRINKEKNGSITNVIQFINNLHILLSS